MAYNYLHASMFWLIIVIQSWDANCNIFSPVIDNVMCSVMECGKGTCKPSQNSTLGFVCECHDGWKQANLPKSNETLPFMPCLIPNCTLNSTCLKQEFSFPTPTFKPNTSTFDPCHWTDCGGGRCYRTSLFNYRCVCEEGYDNMFKVPPFPCYKQCAFQNDCSPLGIDITHTFISSPSANSVANSLAGAGGNITFLIIRAFCFLGMLMQML